MNLNVGTSDSHAVNSLLHRLRGEQFRHSQNVRKSRAHVSSTYSYNLPTLPVDLGIHPEHSISDQAHVKAGSSGQSTYKTYSGPVPPKSWTKLTSQPVHETAAWRADALSLLIDDLLPFQQKSFPTIPLLTSLCLRILLSFPVIEIENMVPILPPHLRRDLIRYAAIHSPLPNSLLDALYQPEGHADRELIVVGPHASLREDFFIKTASTYPNGAQKTEQDESWDWETETPKPELLCTLILMTSRLAGSTLLTLPPTITHMGLINLPMAISLHRLPGTCPLLVVLDLSYNTWLGLGSKDAENIMERVEWGRWSQLRTLGLRGCHISNETRVKLNKGRWDDVEVIQ